MSLKKINITQVVGRKKTGRYRGNFYISTSALVAIIKEKGKK